MQTEQQIPKTKKTSTSSGVKKEKKPKDVAENASSEVQVVKETAPAPKVEVVTETPEVQVSEEANVVVQEIEFTSMIEYMNNVADKITEMTKYFKDNVLSKDERGKVESTFKKLNKSFSLIQTGYTDYLNKQVALLEKHSGSKSSGVKKVTDKEKSAIHKKLSVQPFLLKFMKLPENTQVSRSDALSAITGYVKEEKVKNPDIIVANDKRSFKLIGELKPLFDGIEKIMKSKNLLEGKTMPTEIKYTQIMQYMTHCFVKADEATA
jgi:hypothetical protein